MSVATARARALEIGEMLSPLGAISVTRFFGGAGLLAEGVQFAFVIKGTLYLRSDENSRPLFEEKGARPFSFAKRSGEVTVTSYYEAPDDVIEDAEALCAWARRAVETAHAGAAHKPRRRGDS